MAKKLGIQIIIKSWALPYDTYFVPFLDEFWTFFFFGVIFWTWIFDLCGAGLLEEREIYYAGDFRVGNSIELCFSAKKNPPKKKPFLPI